MSTIEISLCTRTSLLPLGLQISLCSWDLKKLGVVLDFFSPEPLSAIPNISCAEESSSPDVEEAELQCESQSTNPYWLADDMVRIWDLSRISIQNNCLESI